MKKIILPILGFGALGIMMFSITSCQQDISDRFEYAVALDSIKPVISISVPAQNQSFLYGNHVAIVGTVTDLESQKNDIHDPGFRKGQLKSVTIDVADMTNNKNLLSRKPVVTGKDGYSFNERFEIITGSGTTSCRLIISATDASDKTVRDTVDFEYN